MPRRESQNEGEQGREKGKDIGEHRRRAEKGIGREKEDEPGEGQRWKEKEIGREKEEEKGDGGRREREKEKVRQRTRRLEMVEADTERGKQEEGTKRQLHRLDGEAELLARNYWLPPSQ